MRVKQMESFVYTQFINAQNVKKKFMKRIIAVDTIEQLFGVASFLLVMNECRYKYTVLPAVAIRRVYGLSVLNTLKNTETPNQTFGNQMTKKK